MENFGLACSFMLSDPGYMCIFYRLQVFFEVCFKSPVAAAAIIFMRLPGGRHARFSRQVARG